MSLIPQLFAFLCLTSSVSAMAQTHDDVQYILKGINHYRMRHFLLPLKLDNRLNQIAMQHSAHMANHQIPVGHDGFQKRFSNIRQQIPTVRQAAENVAAGYKNLDAVIDGWTHSPGHRQNILAGYRLTGIAIAYDNQHKPYYTQVFAK